MSIVELEFHSGDWHLEQTQFGPVNLLVGNSGVGKTRILRTLQTIKSTANGTAVLPAAYRWNVRIKTTETEFTWIAEMSDIAADKLDDQPDEAHRSSNTLFLEETIYRSSQVLVSRNLTSFEFNGNPLPRLNTSQSAVSLLQNEDAISPLYRSLSRIVASDQDPRVFVTDQDLEFQDLEGLRNAVNEAFLSRALALQRHFPDVFSAVKRDFIDIFTTVQDVKIGSIAEFDPHFPYRDVFSITIGLREQSVDGWIYGQQISSGMLRTIVRLLELKLAPSGSVFLIDEVENSLGLNCLGPLIDHVKENSRHLQFIMTSHHPYIINNIGIDDWRIVTRKGSTVTVRNASEIPALSGQSRQDKFIRLINSPEFEEGVQ